MSDIIGAAVYLTVLVFYTAFVATRWLRIEGVFAGDPVTAWWIGFLVGCIWPLILPFHAASCFWKWVGHDRSAPR